MLKIVRNFLLMTVMGIGVAAPVMLYDQAPAEARRGCCSHHGGVSGCQCADGTPLSAKCAPYYPACSRDDAPMAVTKAAPKKVNHNCQTLLSGQKGAWVFSGENLKSKILVKLPAGTKLVKSGKQNDKSSFFKMQPVGQKTVGFVHKSVVYCP